MIGDRSNLRGSCSLTPGNAGACNVALDSQLGAHLPSPASDRGQTPIARGTATTPSPAAISCLSAFPPPAAVARENLASPAAENLARPQTLRLRFVIDEKGRRMSGIISVTASARFFGRMCGEKVMMRNAPFTSALTDKYGEARWTGGLHCHLPSA